MRVLLGVMAWVFWLASFAQAETLSLRQALVLGLGQNYDLRIAGLDVERADAAAQGEEGRFDVAAEVGIATRHTETPVASVVTAGDVVSVKTTGSEAALSKHFASGLQARLALSGERSDADTLADRLDPAYRTALVLDFSQPLLKDLGADINTTDLRIARTRRQQAAFGYLARAQQLAAEIEQAYLSLAQAEAALGYETLARDLARELLDGNQRKLDAGLVPVTEVNEARSAMAGREESMLLAEQQVVLARNRLLDLIDHGEAALPANWRAQLPEDDAVPVPELETAIEAGLRQRPELQQARLDIDVRRLALNYADNQRLPRLDLEASVGVSGLSGDGDPGSRYDGGWQDAFGGAIDRDGSSWYAGLRFSLPLQNRVARAQYRDAAAQDKQSYYRLRRVEVSVQTAIRSAHDALRLGRERHDVARRYAALAQVTYDQENRRLQEGLSDSFRVLTFQNALVTAKLREVAARADYARAGAALALAMGNNLERYNIAAALPHEGVLP